MAAALRDLQAGERHAKGGRRGSAAAPGHPSTAPAANVGTEVAPARDTSTGIDSHRWTGEVEAQEREACLKDLNAMLNEAMKAAGGRGYWLNIELLYELVRRVNQAAAIRGK